MDHEKLTTQLSLGREGGAGGEKQMTAQQIVRDTIQLCIRKGNTEQLHLAIFEETKDFLAKQEELLTERGNSIADRMNEEWAHGPEYKAANEQFAVELSDDRNDLDAAWEAMAEWRISIGKMKGDYIRKFQIPAQRRFLGFEISRALTGCTIARVSRLNFSRAVAPGTSTLNSSSSSALFGW